jgi:uncharacterized protein (DUF1330 family)
MSQNEHVDPERAQFDFFKSLPRDMPINMLNLLRFREVAAYPEGHSHAGKGLSGAQAYAEYGRTSAAIFARVGGGIVWRGHMEAVLIGPDVARWDASFIASYPTAAAFLEMVTDPDYRIAVVHRQAAVLTSRLIRFAPLPAGGDAFG